MGVFSKLVFWKKKDDLDFGGDFGADLGLPADNYAGAGMGRDLGLPPQFGRQRAGLDQNMNLGMPEDTGFMGRETSMQPPGRAAPMQQPFGAPIQPPQPTEHDYARDKFEVVSAKLDSIRYTLDSINQRLANLERIAYGEQENKKRW